MWNFHLAEADLLLESGRLCDSDNGGGEGVFLPHKFYMIFSFKFTLLKDVLYFVNCQKM